MITPAQILNKYKSVEQYLEPLRQRVRNTLLVHCEQKGFAFVSRIKQLDSVCEKVETGRFSSWNKIDDLVAFTIVVPKLSDEKDVLAFLQDTFEQINLRARGSSSKPPDVFRFDVTRFIGRLSFLNEEPRPPMFDVLFEIQIRSAFEHAWSVTTHALSYKSPDISWRKLRLSSQLKAAVEQLDMLVTSFDDTTRHIDPSTWPEIKAKTDLKIFFDDQVRSGAIPSELAPKDWSRFVENVFSAVSVGSQTKPDEICESIQRALNAELALLGPGAVPLCISLWQLTFASLVKSGTIPITPRKYWPLVTPELEELYPILGKVTQRFDYS